MTNLIAKLQSLALNNTLPHALLFVNSNPAATLQIAQQFSQWLLCSNKQGNDPCGSCNACVLFSAGSHPDICSVTVAQDKTTIAVDDVRTINEFCVGKPQQGNRKIVLLYPAEALGIQAANALLKNLEEPRGDTLFVLLVKHPELLLKTIVSRCHAVHFNDISASATQNAAIIQQIVRDLQQTWCKKSLTCSYVAEQWLKQWPKEVLYWFEVVLTDMIRFKYTDNAHLAQCWSAEETQLCSQLPASKLWAILERLRQAQYWLGQNLKPNMQLLLEDMLLEID